MLYDQNSVQRRSMILLVSALVLQYAFYLYNPLLGGLGTGGIVGLFFYFPHVILAVGFGLAYIYTSLKSFKLLSGLYKVLLLAYLIQLWLFYLRGPL